MSSGYEGPFAKDPDRPTLELDPSKIREMVAAADAGGTVPVSESPTGHYDEPADPWSSN